MTIFRFPGDAEKSQEKRDKTPTTPSTKDTTIIMSNRKNNISIPRNDWEKSISELLPSKHSTIPRKNVLSSKPFSPRSTPQSPQTPQRPPVPQRPTLENIQNKKYKDRNELIFSKTDIKFAELDGRINDINKMSPKQPEKVKENVNDDLSDITSRINEMKLEIKRLSEQKEMEERAKQEEGEKANAASIKCESDMRASLLKAKADAEAAKIQQEKVVSGAKEKEKMDAKLKADEAELKAKQKQPTEQSQKVPLSIARFLEIESIAKPFIESANRIDSDPKYSSNKLKIRMNITRRVGQIANSKKQVHAVIRDLLLLFSDAASKFGNDMANYCVIKCCEKIIDQAETQVCLHTPSAFPLAQMVIDLSVQQKNLIPILTHLIHRRCPYAVPRYIPRKDGQSEQDHRKAMGYLIIEDDDNPSAPPTIEGEQNYIERMTGILSLYGAIIVAKPTIGVPSPFGVENAWLWTASVLNIHPEPITPYMVCSFLETSGYSLWLSYGDTFIKLLHFIKEKYLAMIPDGSIGAKTRLDIYCHYILDKKTVCKPEGFDILV